METVTVVTADLFRSCQGCYDLIYRAHDPKLVPSHESHGVHRDAKLRQQLRQGLRLPVRDP